jgi:hypothetical protein
VASAPAAGQEGGALSVVESTADLGTLVKGDVVHHDFVLRNTGEEPVTIERVAPSCGCTVVEFDDTIPPGGEGTLRAELDTKGLTGNGSSSIEVYVTGQKAPAATVVLEYNVVFKLLAHPGYARWIVVQHEQEGNIAQTVYSTDGSDFEIVSVEPPIPAIEVSFREAKPEERQEKAQGSQWVVSATLDSAAPVGPLTGFIDVATTHPRQKVLQIPVSGFVRPAVFVEPQRGDFGTIDLERPKHAKFQVRSFSSEPIKVTGAEADVPGVSVTIDQVEEGRTYIVTLVFDPAKLEEGRFSGNLRLTTDSEKVPQVDIALLGNIVRSERSAGG